VGAGGPGWDELVSVTHQRNEAAVLHMVEVMELEERDRGALDDRGFERAVTVTCHPRTWAEDQVYVVIRRDRERVLQLLRPAYTVILMSRVDLPVAELVRRHRGTRGQENAFKGQLTELRLHHPPCNSYKANQAPS